MRILPLSKTTMIVRLFEDVPIAKIISKHRKTCQLIKFWLHDFWGSDWYWGPLKDEFYDKYGSISSDLIISYSCFFFTLMICIALHLLISWKARITILPPPPHHLLLDSAPNLGPLKSHLELDKFKIFWNKSFRTSKILTLLYQQFLNL